MELDTKELKHIHAFIDTDAKAIDEDTHSIDFIVSKEVIDRDDEIVLADAVIEAIHRKNEFTANPICLPCHMSKLQNGEPPCVGSWDTETARVVGKAVRMKLRFAMKTNLGVEYWNAYSDRHMRAVSIGFRTLDYRVEEQGGKRIYIATKIELYEISCVAIGSNREALSIIKSLYGEQGKGSAAQLEPLITKLLNDRLGRLEDALTAQLDELKDMIVPDRDDLAKSLMLDGDLEPDGHAEQSVSDEQIWGAFKNVLSETVEL
ncbi:MAG: HK97 family phage prohead protease [Patescibacteria group bacterium]